MPTWVSLLIISLVCPANVAATSTDYAPFASSKFNPTLYANAILAGERYDPEEPPPADAKNGRNEDETGTSKNAGMGTAGNGSAQGTASLSVKGDVSVALAKLNYGIVSRRRRRRLVKKLVDRQDR